MASLVLKMSISLDGFVAAKHAPGARLTWLVAGLAIGAVAALAVKAPW